MKTVHLIANPLSCKYALSQRAQRQRSIWQKSMARLTAVFVSTFVFSAGAQVATNTTIASSLNPSAVGNPVTFTAAVMPVATYLVQTPFRFGVVPTQNRIFRFDLGGGATFGVTVAGTDFANATTPASIAAITAVQGGQVGDNFVVLEIKAGAAVGILSTDTLSFLVRTNPQSAGAMPTVTYSQHGDAASGQGQIPRNTALLFTSGPLSLSSFLVPNTATGTVDFQDGGVSMPGCGAVVLASASATCSITYAVAGLHVITAVYSGDIGNLTSTGTLTGGQNVAIPITPITLPSGNVSATFPTTNFLTTGGTPPYTFAVTGGMLPPGLTLAANGALTGVPTAAGIFDVDITVTDANNATGTRVYMITINKGLQTILFSLPASGLVRRSVPLAATTSSGLAVSYLVTTPLTCSINGTNLVFNAAGSCAVTAIQAGNANFINATNVIAVVNVAARTSLQSLRLRNDNGQTMVARLMGNVLQFTADNDPGPGFRVTGLADLDGNGSSDLIYQNITQGQFGDVRVWKDLSSTDDRLLRSLKLTWQLEAVGDLDGDGFGDLVWRYRGQSANPGDTGVSYVWFTNGTDVAQVRKRGGAPLDWKLMGALDINNDGADDMIYVSSTNEIRALMATPGRNCANLSTGAIPAGFGPVRLADFTGQNRADLLTRNATTGATQLISLNATGVTLPVSAADPNDPNATCTPVSFSIAATLNQLAPTDPTWSYYGAADFNGDGVTDIVWLRPDGTLTLWLMKPNNQQPLIINNVGSAPAGYSVIQP